MTKLPLFFLTLAACWCACGQDAAAPAKQPLDHIIGAVSAIDAGNHTVTVKEDKTGTSQTILLANTKTLLKVEPGAKDLKSAVRINADDLQVGDRVDVRGLKTDTPDTLAARTVVLMSARDLETAHQAQATAWQHSSSGTVSAIDAAAGKITANVRTADGPKPVTVEISKATEFTRYSPLDPKVPAPSKFAEIQPADQIRVIGDKSEDGSSIKAQRVYTGAFRTISATITTIGPDGKTVTVKDLTTKKPVEISLNDDSTIRKLPPQMATMLARRFNPSYKPADGAAAGAGGQGAYHTAGGGSTDGAPAGGDASARGAGNPGGWQRGAGSAPGAGGGPGGGAGRSGDISQMLERVPKVSISELKPGDAVVISGVALTADNSRLLASGMIAGVEPILQSAPQRQGNVGGDWGLGEMAVPQ